MKVSGKTSAVGSAPAVTAGNASSNAKPAAPTGSPVVQDALSVSSNAQCIASATARLALIPDIRTEKVEAIKAKLDSDEYNPDGEAVADGLVREYMPPASSNDLT